MSLHSWLVRAGDPTPEEQMHPAPVRRIKTITEPAAEPTTAAELAEQLKVSAQDEGAILTALLQSARAWCEAWTGRFFITRTAELWLDFWPTDGIIEIPASPITAIASISTFDDDDAETVLDPTVYQVDLIAEPARVVLRLGQTAPTGLRRVNGIKVAFTAGWADPAAVPENIKTAIRLMASEVYLARGAQVDARTFSRNSVAPVDALMMLEPFKVVR